MEPTVNFFHLGMSVPAYSIRVPRVGSTSRALLEHRWLIGGIKLASFPLELAKPYFGRLTRETRMLPYCVAASTGRSQATPPRPQTEPHLQKPFQSAAKALQ